MKNINGVSKAAQILNYLTYKPPYKSLVNFTRISLTNGKIIIGRFLPENQSADQMNQNHWVLIQGGSDARIDINGNDISSIKEN